MAEPPLRYDHGDEGGDHERASAADHGKYRSQPVIRIVGRIVAIDDEEDQQRPVIDRDIEPARFGLARGRRWRLRILFHQATPAMTRATRSGSNGLKSSIFSPTPIAWIGRPYCSAAATSTPPRAVPSSLVMTRPVTPATSRNTSIWPSAFCPLVASSTSTTSCGASGLSRPSTFLILASSSISSRLFCSRPAVSTISVSTS